MSEKHMRFWFFVKMLISVLLLIIHVVIAVTAAYSGIPTIYAYASVLICIIDSAYIGNGIGKYKKWLSAIVEKED